MEVVGYARVVPSAEADDALAHQKARIEAFCRDQNYVLGAFFTEKISSELQVENRTALLQAIEACVPDKSLVVIRLDRLGSNKKVVAKIFELCAGKGVKIVPANGPATVEDMPNTLEVTNISG